MKKTLFLGFAILALATSASAETAKGKVVDIVGDMVTVQLSNGEQVTMATTDETTYRQQKKMRNKTKKGKGLPTGKYQPMIEEDDWIEVVYNPATQTGEVAEIDAVTLYDD